MPDLFDTSSIRDDAQYWDALARRVTSAAAGGSDFGQFAASRTGWITASLFVAAALVLLLLPASSPFAGVASGGMHVLAPSNALGRTIAAQDRAPAIGVLLLEAPQTEAER